MTLTLAILLSKDVDTKPATESGPLSIEEALELAKRAFALKKYEQAVDHYATALELTCVLLSEISPIHSLSYYVQYCQVRRQRARSC
jgi:HAT1-interacting factor 1